jgi:hypothetical protein
MYTLKFDWDPEKARKNLVKHGIAFEDAITAFDDDSALIREDLKHSTPVEQRYALVGRMDPNLVKRKDLMVFLVFTIRTPGEFHRLISARPANRKEKRAYDERQELL